MLHQKINIKQKLIPSQLHGGYDFSSWYKEFKNLVHGLRENHLVSWAEIWTGGVVLEHSVQKWGVYSFYQSWWGSMILAADTKNLWECVTVWQKCCRSTSGKMPCLSTEAPGALWETLPCQTTCPSNRWSQPSSRLSGTAMFTGVACVAYFSSGAVFSLMQPLFLHLIFFMCTLHQDGTAPPLVQDAVHVLRPKLFWHCSFFFSFFFMLLLLTGKSASWN